MWREAAACAAACAAFTACAPAREQAAEGSALACVLEGGSVIASITTTHDLGPEAPLRLAVTGGRDALSLASRRTTVDGWRYVAITAAPPSARVSTSCRATVGNRWVTGALRVV